jgi:mannose-6-phosphate isomerase
MGTHPSGLSLVGTPDNEVESISLQRLLNIFPEYVGNMNIFSRYGTNFLFLFKVLSIGKALSIESHPNKKLAQELHRKDPKNYPDDNHKLEMAIALTDSEALCRFHPYSKIKAFLEKVLQYSAIVGVEAINNYKKSAHEKQGLKLFFTALMTAPENVVTKNSKTLFQRWSKKEDEKNTERKLFLRLY